MWKRLMKSVGILITGILIFQLIGCGTILYPERKGQKSGRIDPGVAILDGVGLLLFLVPGVIAFAVDFATGTIYLPGTAKASLDGVELRQVAFDPEHSSMDDIERIIQRETGYEVNLARSDVEISRLESTDDLKAHFAAALPQTEYSQTTVASLRVK
jgi:hypothetical protein